MIICDLPLFHNKHASKDVLMIMTMERLCKLAEDIKAGREMKTINDYQEFSIF